MLTKYPIINLKHNDVFLNQYTHYLNEFLLLIQIIKYLKDNDKEWLLMNSKKSFYNLNSSSSFSCD